MSLDSLPFTNNKSNISYTKHINIHRSRNFEDIINIQSRFNTPNDDTKWTKHLNNCHSNKLEVLQILSIINQSINQSLNDYKYH